jgi:hypothetical protein
MDRHRAVFYEALDGVDRVIVGDDAAVEDALLIKKVEASQTFSWRVTLPEGVDAVQVADTLRFQRAGRRLAQIAPAFVIDALGVRRAVPHQWQPETRVLSLSPDLRGLVAPVLLDPKLEVWRWDELRPVGGRTDAPAAYLSSPASGKGEGAYLFGGFSTLTLNDLLRWDAPSRQWKIVSLPEGALRPPPRYAPGFAPDGQGHLIMFGGTGGGVTLGDTWSWDGVAWTRLDALEVPVGAQTDPLARGAPGMAYDPARGSIVLHGGVQTITYPNDTWRGSTETVEGKPRWVWRQLANTPGPYGQLMGLAFLKGRLWRWGGFYGGSRVRELHSWSGVTGEPWVLVGCAESAAETCSTDPTVLRWKSGETGPAISVAPVLTLVPGAVPALDRLFTFGGDFDEPKSSRIWAWDGAAWQLVQDVGAGGGDACDSSAPCGIGECSLGGSCGVSQRTSHSQVWNPLTNELLVHGGTDYTGLPLPDSWTWSSAEKWRATEALPLARYGHTFVFDRAGKQLLLFGGSPHVGNTECLADTWSLDTTSPTPRWQLRSNGVPKGRFDAATAYDPTEGAAVLFGGTCVSSFGDTYVWEKGTAAWRVSSEGGEPPTPRFSAAMAYDLERREMVLFGGIQRGTAEEGSTYLRSSSVVAGETKPWRRIPPPNIQPNPGQRAYHAMAFDAVQKEVVLFGGQTGGLALDDTWTWDGKQWRKREPVNHPPPRFAHGMFFDEAINAVVIVGGRTVGAVPTSTVWRWDGSGAGEWRVTPVVNDALPQAYSPVAFDTNRRAGALFSGFSQSQSTLFLTALGLACEQCPGAACVDGVCCNVSSCSGTCQTCNGDTPGVCSPVRGAPDPGSCDGKNSCDPSGACKTALGQPPAQAGCASGFVVDGVCCATPSCEACQTCKAEDQQPEPDGGARPAGACGRAKASLKPECAACRADTDCLAPNKCDFDGVCKPLLPLDVPTGCAQGAAAPSPASLAPLALALLLLRRRRQRASVARAR